MNKATTNISLKTVPVQTAAELIAFMADHQDFSGVVAAMGEKMTATKMRKILKEVAEQLKLYAEANESAESLVGVNKKSKDVLSNLSADESSQLLHNLGFSTD